MHAELFLLPRWRWNGTHLTPWKGVFRVGGLPFARRALVHLSQASLKPLAFASDPPGLSGWTRSMTL